MLPEKAVVLLVHANGIRQDGRLPLGIVDRRIEIVDLTQAVAAELQAVGKHADANFARVKNVLEVVRWGGICIGYVHF